MVTPSYLPTIHFRNVLILLIRYDQKYAFAINDDFAHTKRQDLIFQVSAISCSYLRILESLCKVKNKTLFYIILSVYKQAHVFRIWWKSVIERMRIDTKKTSRARRRTQLLVSACATMVRASACDRCDHLDKYVHALLLLCTCVSRRKPQPQQRRSLRPGVNIERSHT